METLSNLKVSTEKKLPTKKMYNFLKKAKKVILKDYQYYLLCLPVVVYLFIFDYIPMYGIQIAFKDFIAVKGIWGSPWVGLKHFERFVTTPMFWTLIKNTLGISIYSLIAGFPLPIIIALLLNQTRNVRFKKLVQTTLYAPHFISVVVLCGMVSILLAPKTGIINHIISSFGGEKIFFLGKPELYKSIFVWSGIWQNTGWGSIIYIAALSGINIELYEAAKIDGATKLQIIRNVDIPGITPTIVIVFIMSMGSVMNLGFQKAYLLMNPLNIDAAEIISTYVYKIGIEKSQFSYSTAISLFNTAVNLILLVTANKISKKVTDSSLW